MAKTDLAPPRLLTAKDLHKDMDFLELLDAMSQLGLSRRDLSHQFGGSSLTALGIKELYAVSNHMADLRRRARTDPNWFVYRKRTQSYNDHLAQLPPAPTLKPILRRHEPPMVYNQQVTDQPVKP